MVPVSSTPPLDDFPVDPAFTGPNVPAAAPDLFASTPARAGGAPCIVSPDVDTLMPRNWLRPRFEYRPAGDENLFEIRLAVDRFAHPLRLYSASATALLDRALWNRLRISVADEPITVSVRAMKVGAGGAVETAPSAAATTRFTIAPVDAPGKIVYWALGASGSAGATKVGTLKGFGIGEESVQDVLVPGQVQAPSNDSATCIGCHAATPDGLSVGFAMGPTGYTNSVAGIGTATTGAVPSYVSAAGLAAVRGLRGIPTYSPAHFAPGDRVVLLSDAGDLRWVDLEGGAAAVIARGGDPGKATEPTFSHDGQSIVYVSTAGGLIDGRSAEGPMDLYTVPYGARAGGQATPLAGASEAGRAEFYPAFSPDDALVAFTRLPDNGSSYNNPQAEVMVVDAAGGQARRLRANDPPACLTSLASPGLTNDWPKWAPEVREYRRSEVGPPERYYWLTFSSQRQGPPGGAACGVPPGAARCPAQLFVTPVVVSGGTIHTYPALYLWNQPAADGNHTPSWDAYQIPDIVID